MSTILSWFKQDKGSRENSFSWDTHPDVGLPYVSKRHEAVEPYMKMIYPLSAYFISSGHNSYLTGNQLNSYGGVKIIEMCLTANCRVVELDVYNQQVYFNGPVCKHGGTLTPPISFQACVEAVRRCAFINSPYPVILTIENHTDFDNQRQVARILKEVLQEMLFVPTAKDLQSQWKSPEELKNKVVIRCKVKDDWSHDLTQLVYIRNTKLNRERWTPNMEGPATSSSLPEQKLKAMFEKVFVSDLRFSRDRRSSEGRSMKKASSNHSPPAQAPQIQDCKPRMVDDPSIERAQGGRFERQDGSWNRWEREEVPQGDIPLEPDADLAMAVNTLEDVYAYTSKHLLRVYPSGVRVDSSNYDPMRGWTLGASLVAFNWQTHDEHMWIYRAMFSQNAGCGYVLKPDWMLHGLLGWSRSASNRDLPYCLELSLYSAYCDQHGAPKPFKDHLYLTFQILGMPIDQHEWRTATAQQGGSLYIEEKREFELYHPEMAIIKITLWDEESAAVHKLLGHWETPVGTLAEGSYKIELTDRKDRLRNDRWVKLGFRWLVEGMRASSNPGIGGSGKMHSPGALLSGSGAMSSPVRSPALDLRKSGDGSGLPQAGSSSTVSPENWLPKVLGQGE